MSSVLLVSEFRSWSDTRASLRSITRVGDGPVRILLLIYACFLLNNVLMLTDVFFVVAFQGRLYYVRVSAYNMRGWGPAASSLPPSAAPSSEFTLLLCLCRSSLPQRQTSVTFLYEGIITCLICFMASL